MSPAVGTQNVTMPPRTSSSMPEGGGGRGGAGPPGGSAPPPGPPAGAAPPGPMVGQPYGHHGTYKGPHYPPQPYGYPPRNHHPYQYGYRPPPPPHPPQHYPPPIKQQGRHMGPPGAPGGPGGEGAMPPPTAPGEAHDNGPGAPATALVTTGPDGAPLDEGSQQSTLSNASAASGEDTCASGSGKGSRKEYGSAAPSPSPGGASHSSLHDDYEASPSPSPWPRPPSSPKSDSLGKLYEMDDAPERRGWVERLLAFMEERRTPIAACPTISKQPLDLYRLYLLVRDRGGFVEVTKNKTWKDIAGLLGIGASSSAAYTLRKHYTKNLLAYECHFDRGGIDPQPIINQVEASTKKKSGKTNNTSSAGSSNSQESFPVGGAAGTAPAMDGYSPQYAGYPPQPNHSQGYQQGYGYEYGSPYQANRPVYPQYGPDGDRGYRGGAGAGGGAGGEYQYGGYGGGYGRAGGAAPTPPPAASYPEYYRAPHPPHPPNQHPPNQHQPPIEMSGGGGHVTQSSVGNVGNIMSSQLARQLVAPLPNAPRPYYGGGKPAGATPPGAAPGGATPPGAPRRHPDFAKGEPAYGAGGAAGGAGGAGARFPPAWGAAFPRAPQPPAPPGAAPWRPQPPPAQPPAWNHQPYQPQTSGPAWGGAPRPPAQDAYPAAATPATVAGGVGGGAGALKRELTFPSECVEGAVPVGEKRRRLTKADVAPVDAWRIVMALKSGLLAETCWALDILNILLFDDNCIGYFGLQHMPGLLDLLLEHFQRALADVFESSTGEPEPWYAAPSSPQPAPAPRPAPPPADREPRSVRLLHGTENYTMQSRRRHPVTLKPDEEPPADAERDDRDLEPWQFAGDAPAAEHAITCVRTEFLHLPFVRVMPGERAPSPPPAATPAAPTSPAPAPAPAPATTPAPAPSPPRPGPDDMELEPERPRRPTLQIRDPAGVLRRRKLEDYEDECYTRDEPSLNLVDETRDQLARRCIALSNILRGLTFVPGNEAEFSRSGAFLALAGKLLLLHHEHAPRAARARAYERAARDETDAASCCSSLRGAHEWWWDTLAALREDALVACANIAGGLELQHQPEAVARPLLDGLLHWAVCPAAVAGDAPPAAAAGSPLSPRRLALEALCKLCVTDANVDLVVATPPVSRLAALCAGLARDLCRPERPVVREFAVNLLHYLAGAGGCAAREVAAHAPAIAALLAFIERAEHAALGVANSHGVAALRDNPDAMGTSLDMLRRAAATLLRLAERPENRPLIRRHERRLLSLVMSQILDQKVAHELADVLFQCTQPADAPSPSPAPADLE